MITATITVTDTSTSLFDLINVALPNKLQFNGRVAEIQVKWLTGAFFLFDIPGLFGVGAGPTAANAGYAFGNPTTADLEALLVLRQGGINGLSLKDTFLGTAAGTATARVLAYTL